MEEKEVKTPEELTVDDAFHYLGGFKLPLKSDTLYEEVNEDGSMEIKLDEEFALRYKAFTKRMKQMEEELDAFKSYAYEFLSSRNYDKHVSQDGVNLVLNKPYTRTNIKSAELKEVLPQIYEMFSKEINVKGSVGIKIIEDEPYNPWDFLKNG